MSRTKSSVVKKARVKKILSRAKGYYGKRKNLYTIAKQSVVRSEMFAFAHRRKKKNDFRRLWIVRLNATLFHFEIKYSKFIPALKKANILLNRKSLSMLAIKDEKNFSKIINKVKPHLSA